MKSRVASKASKACLTMLCDTKADGMSQAESTEASSTTMFQEVSRQKQLITVFGKANAQKQGVMGVRLASRAVRLCFKRAIPYRQLEKRFI